MTHIPTTVYLNDAPTSFLGFNRHSPAQPRHAISFQLPIPTNTRPHQSAIAAALETVFEQLNIDAPVTAWAQQYPEGAEISVPTPPGLCVNAAP